jgi:hypothetical protein
LESVDFGVQFLRYAKCLNAECYFASVGLANAFGTNDLEMSLLSKHGSFKVAYSGLINISERTLGSIVNNESSKILNQEGIVSGEVEKLEDGRFVLKGSQNSDFGSLMKSIYFAFADDISEEKKRIFSSWAQLPANNWTQIHREEFANALMHYFLEIKEHGGDLPESLIKSTRLLKPQMLVPLRNPLTNEIRLIFKNLFC